MKGNAMNNTAKLLIAGLSAALVFDGIVAHHNKKVDKNLRFKNQKLRDLLNSSLSREMLLAEKLDAAGIEMTEFDQVVYHAL